MEVVAYAQDGLQGKTFLAECEIEHGVQGIDAEQLMSQIMPPEFKAQDMEEVKEEQQQFSEGEELKVLDFVGEGPDQAFAALACSVEEFRSKRYYLFNSSAHDLMIASLLESTNPTASEISAADPTFQPLPWQNKRGIAATCAIEDRWRDFKAKLGVKIDAAGKRFLFHKRDTSRYIPHTGQWLDIVKSCHVDAAERHWGRNLTKHQITKRWMYGERNHGIPETFVDAFIDSCGCCRREQIPVATPPQVVQSRKRKLGKKLGCTALFDVQFIKQKLDEIAQQVVAVRLDTGSSLKHIKGLEDVSSSEFEKLNEEEQRKLEEKLINIRNEMDSMRAHLPSMSRAKFLHFLEAMDGALTELRNPSPDRKALAAKLPAIHAMGTEQPGRFKDEFQQEPFKPTKKVKWKDLARPQHKDSDGTV